MSYLFYEYNKILRTFGCLRFDIQKKNHQTEFSKLLIIS